MKRIPKWIKILLLILLLGAVVGGGGYQIYQGNFGGAVSVYQIDGNISTEESWYGNDSMDGTVKNSGTQSVTLSDTQTVGKTLVKQGDTVKKGDALFSYDSTLADIQIERQNIIIKQLKMQLDTANNQLKTIRSYKPGVPVKVENFDNYIASKSKADATDSMKANTASSSGAKIVLLHVDNSSSDQDTAHPNGSNSQSTDGGQTNGAADSAIDEPDSSMITYTRSELNEMIQEKKDEIRDLNLQLRQAQLESKKLENEKDNTTVYSKLDGTVSYVGNPSDKSKPYIKITAGGGDIVQVNVDEWSLSNVKIGQGVSVTNWMNGEEYRGTVQSIGVYPVSDYQGSNANASYYPVTVELSNATNLNENDYVGVTLDTGDEESDSFYLESSFVLTEGNQKYVYVRGEDGLLSKHKVKVGTNLDGYYQEILDGVQMGDWIAFPYGKNVKEGAKTTEADISDLW
ncbi:MAG: hypothetical protein LUE11_00210 [Clostridia bacterium]|nr:hypothetical protein [Clostridia bacterium]